MTIHTPRHGSTDKVCHPDAFITRDSGVKAEYADGMRRDSVEGKPTFGLMFPKDVPYEEQLLTRVAMLYMRGGVRYGSRNWEKSSTEESLAHHEEALWRHFVKFVTGVEDGEDHAAAVVWNVNAVLLTRRNIKLAAEAVNSGNTAEEDDESSATDPLGYDVTQVGDGLTTYVFPVAGHEYVSKFGKEIKIKARNFDAARHELDKLLGRYDLHVREPDRQQGKLLGRETAEHSMELDRQQDEQETEADERERVRKEFREIGQRAEAERLRQASYLATSDNPVAKVLRGLRETEGL